MTAPIIILRPEPGASATAARVAASGLTPVILPLFAVEPVVWVLPDPGAIDALLLTSANAVRMAGPQLDRLSAMPAWCVGQATAAAARTAGLTVARIGTTDAQTLIDSSPDGGQSLLWLAGEDRRAIAIPSGFTVTTVTTYRAVPTTIDLSCLRQDAIVLVHSARAAARLAALAPDRSRLHLVAISQPVARAAGDGWRGLNIAAAPDDADMVAIARQLWHKL